jgi:DNA-binding response OmpR family regulator
MDEAAWQAKILIVEDTPSTLKMVITALQDEGYEIIVATSGKEAIQRVKLTKPDIVLMDIMMPEKDGYETCRQLKSSNEIKNIPIIFTSSLKGTFDKVKGFDFGGVDYVAKPIDPPELLSRIRTHLTIRRLQKELEDANVQGQ